VDAYDSIVPDTADWTWVTERPCRDCGFDPAAVTREELPRAIRTNAEVWQVVLAGPDVAVRPDPATWSPLEYACHVRDVDTVFAERVRLMLAEDDPEFANWDQDRTAAEQDYGSQDPAAVARELAEAAERAATTYEQVRDVEWGRSGRRSNGSAFTVDSIARYHLHDLVHHVHDVAHVTRRLTVDAYHAHAAAYATGTAAMPDGVAEEVRALADALGAGGRVLEIGSASGRDAAALEAAGLVVRRTDVTPAFVDLLRESGAEADLLDPLVDDLTDPAGPYDAVWANASLLHVRREDLPVVLARLAEVTRPGGRLVASLKEGDGDLVSTHGHVAAPRHFTLWREDALRAVVEGAGWSVETVGRSTGRHGEPWLDVRGTRR
jgi:SAM-dependent methyltransferase